MRSKQQGKFLGQERAGPARRRTGRRRKGRLRLVRAGDRAREWGGTPRSAVGLVLGQVAGGHVSHSLSLYSEISVGL